MNNKQRLIALKNDLNLIYGNYADCNQLKLLLSALTDYNPLNSTDELRSWLQELNSKQFFQVEEIPFSELKQWSFDPLTGNLNHISGKFFNIKGLEVYNYQNGEKIWDQPIIDQSEIGILGILCKEIDSILYLLMQAKAEPGNINTYQLFPTVQATRSNYLQVHGGKRTKYLEYFNGEKDVQVILDQYQSEQGARFLGKRNRNIMVLCKDEEEIELSENHRWMTLGQLKTLMETDNTVNMDSRSIISMVDYSIPGFTPNRYSMISLLNDYRDIISRSNFWLKANCNYICESHCDLSEIRNRLTWKRYYNNSESRIMPLKEIRDWEFRAQEIVHKDHKYFKVIAVRIKANNREVDSWDQPIIKQRYNGKIALFFRDTYGVTQFLIQMKMEPGLYDMIELAPTVQCIEQNYDTANKPVYLKQINNCKPEYSVYQSEEGGRFFQECSQNLICYANGSQPPVNDRFIYIELKQLKHLVQFQQLINVELRSLLAYF